jgi:cell division protein FtsI (penicillin-binding protein 3)/stage V sporulation protein D (sporulation-specific penicillin-binding protein)
MHTKGDTVTEDQRLRSEYRAHLVIFIWFIVAVIIVGRAFYVQVIRHGYYVTLATKQYVSTTPINFDRGTIFFSHYQGDLVPAAQLRTTYRLAVDPTQVKDAQVLYTLINPIVPLDQTQFMEKALKKNDPYEEVAKGLSPDVVTLLKARNLPGISFVKDNVRAYPQESVGSKVIGFVGNDGTQVRGQYGLERYYDDVLTRSSSENSINFFAELFTDIQKTVVSNTPQEEGDVVLTIDSEAERALHSVLLDTKEQWKSDTIGGIVMDPKTGAIIAMDGLPSFDPNQFSQVKDASVFLNQNVSGVYEMGSIIKPLTMAAAIDSGAIDETKTVYDDKGFRDLNGYKVRNYDGKARGPNTSMQTILNKSLNVGIVFLVEQLGTKRFQTYFKKYGLGSDTGIDLPSEASGLTKNLDSNVFVDSATAGFGQGIAVTPIQTIRALAALGNGGKLVKPHVVDSIIYQDGTTKKIIPDDGDQVISANTSERISRMLVNVVDVALQNGNDKMPHYSIAAKTGTAQMPKPGGGYYDDRYLHSFFGYFPAYDPKYIIFLFHTYPKGAEYASATLSDPFFKMVKFLISYYEVPPDR